MSQQANDNFKLNAPKLLDQRSGKFVAGTFTAYADKPEAIAAINIAYRSEFLLVYIMIGGIPVEHWFYGGIADVNLVPKENPCDYYLDPTTGQPWINSTVADVYITANANGCKTKHITILSYDLIGNEQEFWYQDGVNIVTKIDYKSVGENASRFGSLINVASNRNSIAEGHGSFTGIRHNITAWNGSGANKLLTVDVATGVIVNKKIALFRYGYDLLVLATVTNIAGTVLTLDINPFGVTSIPGNELSQYKMVVIEVDNTKYGLIASGVYSVAEGVGSMAFGGGYAKGLNSIAIKGEAFQEGSVAIFGKTSGAGFGGVAIGANCESTIGTAIAIGYVAKANAFYAISISLNGRSDAEGSLTTGKDTVTNVNAKYSHASGKATVTDNAGELAIGADSFDPYNMNNGRSQSAWLHLTGETVDATMTTLLDAIGNQKVLRGDLVRVWISIMAVERGLNNAGNGTCKVWEGKGVWRSDAVGAKTLTLDTPITVIYPLSGAPTWVVNSITLDNGTGKFQPKVTGEVGKTIRWSVRVDTHEMLSGFFVP